MSNQKLDPQTINTLIADLINTRQRTMELVDGLNKQQLIGPKLDTVNPLIWEIGHVAYFYEFWILRHLDGADSFLKNADELYDSINIAHHDRWDLPFLSLDETKNYMHRVHDAVIQRLKNGKTSEQDIYLSRYALFHEDMHTEAFTYARRTLDYPTPIFANSVSANNTSKNSISTNSNADDSIYNAGPLDGDVEIEGGEYLLGAAKNTDFCFDNEKWQHPVTVAPFAIARAATNYQQYAEFVDDGGYSNQQFWDDEGWSWLQDNTIEKPNGWKKDSNDNWLIKQFDQWLPMNPHAAVIHINWHEANAWCHWANRRLPTEAEWELAASGTPNNINEKRLYPWGNEWGSELGNEMPTEKLANMNSRAMRTIDVGALPNSDSAFGCRQMLGNVWEWTSDTFNPYPGFTPDMYQDYSQPLFGITKVLRGGAWTTRSRMIKNTWRTYYGPNRNDVFAGFRSCALQK